MGLLEKINSLQNTGSVGLLARASQISSKTLNFCEWATKNSIKRAAVFSPLNNFYYISDSINIDARTTSLSVSTADFWSGSVDFTKRNFQSFSKKEGTLGRFYQFFREDLRHDVEELLFLPYDYKGNTNILMIVLKQGETFVPPSVTDHLIKELSFIDPCLPDQTEDYYNNVLSEIDESYQANLFILSYKLSIEQLFEGIDISQPDIKEHIVNSMTKNLFDQLSKLFALPNCIAIDSSNEFKIVFLTKEEVDDKLLLAHIKTCLADYLGEKSASSLVLLIAGVTKNTKGAVTFLLKG